MARGVAAGGGAGATEIGAAFTAFVGAGMGAIIGYVRGATAGARITAGLQKCEGSVFKKPKCPVKSLLSLLVR